VSIDFAKHAQSIGADIISLIFLERHYSDDQVYNHFNAVANSVDIGILIHEQLLPSSKGGPANLYPLELLDRLADIDNVVAIKEDSKKPTYSEKVIETVGDRLNVIISGRGKRQYIHFSRMGCHGYLVGVGSFAPRVSLDFYKACIDDDMETAWGIINEIERPFLSAGMKYGWHPALKSAMEELGIMSRAERLPLVSIPDNEHKELVKVLFEIKNSKYYKEGR
jgi:4-hydroxy-tetrahydrodipicolinate synthase